MPEPILQAVRKPAVPVSRSIQPDHLVCLEDGRKLKALKRHLRTAFQLSPEEYRARWKLPADYPMVAPAVTEHRRQIALRSGLGRKPRATNENVPSVEAEAPPQVPGQASMKPAQRRRATLKLALPRGRAKAPERS